jgi:para-aminobenzoate synthetase/4-amino-4-deoxychorismate lyase
MRTPKLRFGFGSPLCFENPTEIIVARTLAEVRPALRRVQAATEAGFWAAGYVAYEAAPAFDPALCVHAESGDLPLLWFGIFEAPTLESPHPVSIPVATGEFKPAEWQPESSRTEYDQAIQTIRASIAAGDVYQVNHTFRLHAPLGADAASPFPSNLPAPYAADLDMGRFRIVSASPELFFHQTGRRIVTRPMKGTRRRGRWAEEDTEIAAELVDSEKDRAENVMIVDYCGTTSDGSPFPAVSMYPSCSRSSATRPYTR